MGVTETDIPMSKRDPYSLFTFLKNFIDSRERGREGEKNRRVASCTGPDQGLNLSIFRMIPNQLGHTSQGEGSYSLKIPALGSSNFQPLKLP